MKNLYELRITGKDPKRFIKYLINNHINVYNITYNKDYINILVDKNNLIKIQKIKTSYKIKIIKYYGFLKYKDIFKKNKAFLLSLLIGIGLLFCFSKIILSIEVIHHDKKLQELLLEEVNNQGIRKFRFKIGYQKKESIKNNILDKYKDKIEWLEITNIGTKYIINVEERIINHPKIDNTPRNIVASKDGIIGYIEASSGEIIKKVNDYVRKGDIIISGRITKNNEITNYVKAQGKIYAETWYQVSVEVPLIYYEQEETGRKKRSIVIQFLNKKININSFLNNKHEKIIMIKHPLLPIFISLNNSKEIYIIDDLYTIEEALEKGLEIGREKLMSGLKSKEKILIEKILNSTINNNMIKLEIFFKVYENITSYKNIEEEIVDE